MLFKKIGHRVWSICYVSTFTLALGTVEHSFTGCGFISFHQPGGSVMSLSSPFFILWLREPDATCKEST